MVLTRVTGNSRQPARTLPPSGFPGMKSWKWILSGKWNRKLNSSMITHEKNNLKEGEKLGYLKIGLIGVYRKHRCPPTKLKTNWTLYTQSFSQLKTISLLSHAHISVITWMNLVWTLPYFSILLVGLRSWIPRRRPSAPRVDQREIKGRRGKRNNKRGCLQHRKTHRFTVCKAKVWLLRQQSVSRWETSSVILLFLCCFWFYIRPNFLSKHPNHLRMFEVCKSHVLPL